MITPGEVIAAINENVIVPVVAALVSLGAAWLSTRQARDQSHDQVILERDKGLWQTLKADNDALREEVRALRAEVASAEDRIDQLEHAMQDAGVPVPPRP